MPAQSIDGHTRRREPLAQPLDQRLAGFTQLRFAEIDQHEHWLDRQQPETAEGLAIVLFDLVDDLSQWGVSFEGRFQSFHQFLLALVGFPFGALHLGELLDDPLQTLVDNSEI